MSVALFGAGAVVALAGSAASPTTVVSDRNVPIEPGTRRETVVEGLENPWAMAWLPDGTLLVTERPGRLRIVREGRLEAQPVAGVPAVFAQGQGGLLDVAVHPRFAENRLVYLTYAAGTPEANRTRVARGELVGGELKDVRTIFEVSQAKSGGAHFGSRLAWLPDGTLLVSIGDGGNPPLQLEGRFIRDNAQDPKSHLGKVVRLRDDGTPVGTSDAAGADTSARAAAGAAAGTAPGVWTLGHRNVQGLAWDPFRRAVWATEHGALGGDELNRLVAGGNYGWPAVSRTREYVGAAPVGAPPPKPGMREPELLWEVAVAPSGLAVYDGGAFPQWRGDLFSGSLMGADVRRLDLDDAGRVVGETALRVGARVRDVRVGPDGFLYVLTDERSARLFRYVPSAQGQTMPPAQTPAPPASPPAPAAPAAPRG